MKENGRKTPAGRMLERLTEFAETLESGGKIEDRYTCREVRLNLKPSAYTPQRVRQTRKLLGLSQALFAQFLGVSLQTVSAWEQGQKPPRDIACRFLDEVRHDPAYWRARLAAVMAERVK
jgi:putative transcriptional regulator